MAGYRNRKIRMPRNPIGSPRKIAQRGFYEMFNILLGNDVKPRDYGKKLRDKK